MGKRYDKETVKAIRAIIKREQEKNPDIDREGLAAAISAAGYKTTAGGEFNAQAVSNFCKGNGHGIYKPKFKKRRRLVVGGETNGHHAPKSKGSSDDLALAEIVMASNVDEEKKKALLRSIFK